MRAFGHGSCPLTLPRNKTMPITTDKGVIDESWSIRYDDEEVIVQAGKRRLHHTLLLKSRNGFERHHPFEVFFRVLNELVWFLDVKLEDINGGHGRFSANLNFQANDDSYMTSLSRFQQQVHSSEQHLALGFFREGHCSSSAFYQFLCFAKILEIPFRDGKDKGIWIDQAICELRDELALTVKDRDVVMLKGKTLGMWLKQDGRDALSHANIIGGATVRDPNSYRDWDEIKWANTVMRELAERVMMDKIGIPPGDAARTR